MEKVTVNVKHRPSVSNDLCNNCLEELNEGLNKTTADVDGRTESVANAEARWLDKLPK